jgi:hypothetical protein
MTSKGFRRNRSWPNFNLLFRNWPVGTEEKHEKSHDRRSPSRDLNPGPSEYEAGGLTTVPRRSVPPFLVQRK